MGKTFGNLNPRMFLVDIEASGVSPFSGFMTEFGVVDYDTHNWFRGVLYDTKPNPDLPAQPMPVREHFHYQVGYSRHDLDHGYDRNVATEQDLFTAFTGWLTNLCGSTDRPVLVSDNNGYDYQWLNYSFDKNGMPNPFGHSSRRIGDLCAGFYGRLNKQSVFKGWREIPHTHAAHFDSMGNAISLRKLVEKMDEQQES